MKRCANCQRGPDAVTFSIDRSKPDGLQSYCVTCSKEKKKEHYLNHKNSYRVKHNTRRAGIKEEIFRFKESNPCTRCGLYYPHFVMDFDHISDKKFRISKATSDARSKEKIWKEIQNTQLVCRNCHAIITYNRGYAPQKSYIKTDSVSASNARNRRKEARDFVRSIKKDMNWCLDCKKVFPHYALDFDHVRGEKKFEIARGCSERTIATIEKELEKCELICKNCHALRTGCRAGWPTTHAYQSA